MAHGPPKINRGYRQLPTGEIVVFCIACKWESRPVDTRGFLVIKNSRLVYGDNKPMSGGDFERGMLSAFYEMHTCQKDYP